MPIRYEDRTLSELKQLAKKRTIKTAGVSKQNLIKALRGTRKVSPLKKSNSIRKSKSRRVRFERCVKKVKSKQSPKCKKLKYKSPKCYNPWAVCNKSIYG